MRMDMASRGYWQELKFIKDGRTLDWTEAVSHFRDSTGQPGPATWEKYRSAIPLFASLLFAANTGLRILLKPCPRPVCG